MIKIKTEEEIKIMAEGGRILSAIMKELMAASGPGISTKKIDDLAGFLVTKYKVKPAFKGFGGFPGIICASLNEDVVHGAPLASKILKEGDIFSIDMGIIYKGYYTDMAVTVPIGEISPEALRLIRITKKSLKRGIGKIRTGLTFGDVSNTIGRYLEDQGYGIVRELCGHGIGKELHEDPQISNYGQRKTGPKITVGMVFCIEPMVTTGGYDVKKSKDGYGYATKDGSLSAHFEHTIAVTSKGVKVLTAMK